MLIYKKSGDELSPINKKPKEDANIKATTQVRCGTEYVIRNPKRDIHLRMGAFYDPEPAANSPDNFYGVSCGSGITFRGESKKELFALDFFYQFRFGEKRNADTMQGESITNKIKEHYFYTSIIYYLF